MTSRLDHVFDVILVRDAFQSLSSFRNLPKTSLERCLFHLSHLSQQRKQRRVTHIQFITEYSSLLAKSTSSLVIRLYSVIRPLLTTSTPYVFILSFSIIMIHSSRTKHQKKKKVYSSSFGSSSGSQRQLDQPIPPDPNIQIKSNFVTQSMSTAVYLKTI